MDYCKLMSENIKITEIAQKLERQLRLSEEKFDRLLSVHEAAMEMWRREKEALEAGDERVQARNR